MEARGGAHHWGSQIIGPGHECMLIPPPYVKPFVERQTNDSNDAAAIAEAALRPAMRFVAMNAACQRPDMRQYLGRMSRVVRIPACTTGGVHIRL